MGLEGKFLQVRERTGRGTEKALPIGCQRFSRCSFCARLELIATYLPSIPGWSASLRVFGGTKTWAERRSSRERRSHASTEARWRSELTSGGQARALYGGFSASSLRTAVGIAKRRRACVRHSI